MSKKLIKNAKLVNEGSIIEGDILIQDDIIQQIGSGLSDATAEVFDAAGSYVLPGIIDDQVHFREPGLTHKGTIATESRAAVAGGITTFMEQPNTKPQTTTIKKLEEKFAMAQANAFANYSFLFGGTNDNLEELKRLDKNACSGVKLFLGSSTGNMLVDDEVVIEQIFSNTEMVISAHCEDETTIKQNLANYKETYGDDIPVKAIALAKKTGARLHVFHLSTGKETELFRNDVPLQDKKITAEVCIHHLWFSDADYDTKETLIKWNPAVKTMEDREKLWEALLDDRLDVIATDHAPHLLSPAMLEKFHQGMISLERIVEKMCHNPAILFQIHKRGYLREGYYADLVIADLKSPWQVSKSNIAYHCGWSPFEGDTFSAKITHTFVNGHLAYENGNFSKQRNAKRLTFDRK